MAFDLDSIQETFQWPVRANAFGMPYSFVGVFRVTDNNRKQELLLAVARYGSALEADPNSEGLKDLGIAAVAREVFAGWVEGADSITRGGEPLPSTPENVEWLLGKVPGVDVAVAQAWFEASNGGKARLGNSPSSAGFGRLAQEARAAGRP